MLFHPRSAPSAFGHWDTMQAIEEHFCLMNTHVACKVFGPQADEALLAIQAELYRLEGLLSRYQRKSDISKINKASGRKAVKVDQATFAVLKRAQQFSSLSDGLFSLLVGPLVDLWDYKKAKQKPDEAAIQKVLSLLDCTDLVLCDKDQSAFLPYKGQSIDLGAIGKGYAA
ncbi:MAG: hypothetical protein EOM15_13345, partial [Spirochaetia bacterium]|nr:hypothetical protein [Spirochaetia bacterium]